MNNNNNKKNHALIDLLKETNSSELYDISIIEEFTSILLVTDTCLILFDMILLVSSIYQHNLESNFDFYVTSKFIFF